MLSASLDSQGLQLRIGRIRASGILQLAEVGESLRTAQALLGHSDLETTLNVYTHAIPDAQRRAVNKLAELFVH